MGEIERGLREPEPEGLDYVKVGLGLVFVFGAFVFGILSPPGTLVISTRAALSHPEQRRVNNSSGGGDGDLAHREGG